MFALRSGQKKAGLLWSPVVSGLYGWTCSQDFARKWPNHCGFYIHKFHKHANVGVYWNIMEPGDPILYCLNRQLSGTLAPVADRPQGSTTRWTGKDFHGNPENYEGSEPKR